MNCPIINAPCDKEKCGWWSEDSQKCAVLVAAENLKKGVELEGFKLSLGDIFFGMVVDRVIERVKAQPTIKQEVTREAV